MSSCYCCLPRELPPFTRRSSDLIGATAGGTAFFREIGSGATLTLGSGLTLNQTGRVRLYANSGALIVNQGTLNAAVSGSYFGLYGSIVNQGQVSVSGGARLIDYAFGSFTNQGTIALASGGQLRLGGSFSPGNIGFISNSGGTVFIQGTLNAGGSTLPTGTGTLGTVALKSTGTIVGGTVTGSGLVLNGGTLSGVTDQATLDLSSSGARVNVTNGITLTGAGGSGAGTVQMTGGNSYLSFQGTQQFDNALVNIGATASGGAFFREFGSGATLTLGSGLTLNQTGRVRLYADPGAVIVNQGTLNAAVSGSYF